MTNTAIGTFEKPKKPEKPEKLFIDSGIFPYVLHRYVTAPPIEIIYTLHQEIIQSIDRLGIYGMFDNKNLFLSRKRFLLYNSNRIYFIYNT